MFISSDAIIESFELGTFDTVQDYFFNTTAHTYKLVESDTVVRVDNSFFRRYGWDFDSLIKSLRNNLFVPLGYSEDGFGFYYENDYRVLIANGVWSDSFRLVRFL